MHHCLKVPASLQAVPRTVQKGASPPPKIGAKPGVSLLAAKIPLKTIFISSAFAKKGCHHSKDLVE